MPLDQIDVGQPAAVPGRHLWPVLRAPAARRSGAFLRQTADVRPVLVGDQVQGHHGGRDQPRGLLVRRELGGITHHATGRRSSGCRCFIAMDPPRHDEQRKVVQPDRRAGQPGQAWTASSASAPGTILDGLPRGETFDWVDHVSIELTTHDAGDAVRLPVRGAPQADLLVGCARPRTSGRRRLRRQPRRSGSAMLQRVRCGYFIELWNERVNAPPRPDLISMLAHGEATRNMDAAGVPRQPACC